YAIAEHGRVFDDRQSHFLASGLTKNDGRLVDLAHQRLELNRLSMQVEAAFIETCECQQAVDEIGHAGSLVQRFLERHQSFVGWRIRVHCPFNRSAQHGEWCLELMTGIGSESSKSAERGFETTDHCVQRRGQARNFVASLFERETTVKTSTVSDRFDFIDELCNGTHGSTCDHIREVCR